MSNELVEEEDSFLANADFRLVSLEDSEKVESKGSVTSQSEIQYFILILVTDSESFLLLLSLWSLSSVANSHKHILHLHILVSFRSPYMKIES